MTRQTIRAGIKTVLEAANSGLRVYEEESPEDPEFPCLVLFNGPEENIAPTALQWDLASRLYIFSGTPDQGWAEVDKYLEPAGTESIIAGIATDPSLNGTADVAKVRNPIGEGNIRDPNGDGSQNIYSTQIMFRICY